MDKVRGTSTRCSSIRGMVSESEPMLAIGRSSCTVRMTPGGHCVRGEHFTSCFCRHDVLRFGGVDDWCQANGSTRCATGPALRDIMSVHEAGRCQQEHHGVEQASAEIGLSFWAGGLGGSRATKRNLCSILAPAALFAQYLDLCASTDS